MVLISTLVLALLSVQSPAPSPGQVRLPLDEYVALVERAEAAARAARDADSDSDAAVAELVSQQTSIVWAADGAAAEITTTYEVELRGTPTLPVVLPVTGLVWNATIEPDEDASLHSDPAGLRFVAPSAGRYSVEVSSRAAIELSLGVARLKLARFTAPVGEYELTMPEELLFRCDGAVIADDSVRDEGRVVRFALRRGEPAFVEARRDLMGAEAESVLASAVVVTVIDLQRDGPVREDIVLYDVSRGAMETFALTLPRGLDVERVRTDEGESPGLVDARTLTVDRETKLSGSGFVRLSSHPSDELGELPLDPVTPATDVRARYLALRSSIAADVAPLPERAWMRVDLGDLPGPVRSDDELVAAWRRDGDAVAPTLRVVARPPAPALETVVDERDSLTLVTADGSLVHRESFDIETSASAFRLGLDAETTLWSVRVNDLLVRPIERDGTTLIPLGFSGGLGHVKERVEVVAVRNQALPDKRTTLELTLPRVDAPVRRHTWRLMLPEGSLYRYIDGELMPAVDVKPSPEAGRFAVEASSRAIGLGGSASIWGRVFDAARLPLPGVTVTLDEVTTGWSATVESDRNGAFSFVALRKGVYTLQAHLMGFNPGYYEGIELASGENAAYGIPLEVGGIAESVTVTGEPPSLVGFADEEVPSRAPAPGGGYRREADALKQGLVGGVKPIPIVIPETGKLLILTGVLPPTNVSVELEVKPN